jgi:hypothetical protein
MAAEPTTFPLSTYEQTRGSTARKPVVTNNMMTLELQGGSVFIQNSDTILFELSQAPKSGSGSALAVERVLYTNSHPGSQEPQVKTRTSHIYDLKAPNLTHPAMRLRNTLELSPERGQKSCIGRPAVIVKGKPFPLCHWIRYGNSWHIGSIGKKTPFLSSIQSKDGREFRDASGTVVAVSRDDVSAKSELGLKADLDEKTLNTLIALWCGSIWFVRRQEERSKNLNSYKKFGNAIPFGSINSTANRLTAPYFSKKDSKRPIRLMGSNIPAALQ